MSRIGRAFGFGDGEKRSGGPRADSPKVRRIRETMRWRGYDLSEYSDEQIAAASARFPNDISEDGETTEDGRRALAAALEQGDFSQPPSPPPPPVAEPPSAQEAPPVASTPLADEPAEPVFEAPPSRAAVSAHRAALGMPTMRERLGHVFGAHAWRPIEGGEGARMQCVGCGQLRNEPIPFRAPPPPSVPPTPPPSAAPPPPPPTPPPSAAEPETRREPPTRPTPRREPGSPLDDIENWRPRERPETPQRPQQPQRPQRPDSPWAFFMGLPWWTKLLAVFIAIQVVLFIISAISGGGG